MHQTADIDEILYKARPSGLAMLGCVILALTPGALCLLLWALAAWL